VSVTGAPAVPEASPSTIRAMVDMFADKHDPGPVAIRARPATSWTGTSTKNVPITAVPAGSALAVREALRAHRAGEWTVILTDRDPEDLGAGILAHLLKTKVHAVDAWGAVQEVFRASQSACVLREHAARPRRRLRADPHHAPAGLALRARRGSSPASTPSTASSTSGWASRPTTGTPPGCWTGRSAPTHPPR
jgi:hypothetical protein